MTNKGLSLVNLVLIAGLIIAVVMLFMDKPKTSELQGEEVADTLGNKNNNYVEDKGNATGSIGQLKVVYVNTDSLWDQYDFVNNTLKGLEKEQKRLQTAYESKMKKLEQDYGYYMQNGASLSLAKQKEYEDDLKKQQADIKLLEDEVANKLIVKKQALNQQINDTILNFLIRYRNENGYDMILQHSYLSGVLVATPEIDITKDVIRKLNAEYQSFK